MKGLPIAVRELRVAGRRSRTYWIRLLAAGWAMLLFVATLWLRHLGAQWSSSEVFQLLEWNCFAFALFGGALATSDGISREKREETIGLLFLTDLRRYDVVLGKLFAHSLTCLFALGAMLPVLAIPILTGGVQYLEFGRVALALLNTLFVSLAIGLCVSVLSRNSFRATTVSLLLLAGLSFGVPLVALGLGNLWNWRRLAAVLRLFSPLQTLDWASSGLPWRPTAGYWWSLGCTFALGLAAVGLTCALIGFAWREASGQSAWTGLGQWAMRVRSFSLGGDRQERPTWRGRLLEYNPIAWLGGRQVISSPGVLLALVALAGLGNWIGSVLEQRSYTANGEEQFAISLLTSAVLHLLVLLRVSSVAGQRFGDDRQSGVLELILGSRLNPGLIVRGQWQAVFRQMAGPVLVVLGVHAWVLLQWLNLNAGQGGDKDGLGLVSDSLRTFVSWRSTKSWEASFGVICILGAGVVLVAHWVTLGWVSMWLSLRLRQPRLAPWLAWGVVLAAPWPFVFLSILGILDYQSIWPEPRWILMCLRLIIFIQLLSDLSLSLWAASHLLRHFRTAVTEPPVPLTPRLLRARARTAFRWIALPACLAALLGLFHLEENWRGRWAWAKMQRDASRAGEFLAAEPLRTERIPREQNFIAAPGVRIARGKAGRRGL